MAQLFCVALLYSGLNILVWQEGTGWNLLLREAGGNFLLPWVSRFKNCFDDPDYSRVFPRGWRVKCEISPFVDTHSTIRSRRELSLTETHLINPYGIHWNPIWRSNLCVSAWQEARGNLLLWQEAGGRSMHATRSQWLSASPGSIIHTFAIICIVPTFSYDKKPAGTFSYPRNPQDTFAYRILSDIRYSDNSNFCRRFDCCCSNSYRISRLIRTFGSLSVVVTQN